MADIHIDTSALTCKHFSIPGHVGVTDGSTAPVVSLAPGVYDFQQFGGDLTAFRFEVTADGLVQYDASCDAFVSGRGSTTLTAVGYELTIDTRALSHDLRFYGMLGDTPTLSNAAPNKVRLIPGDGYLLNPGVLLADFRFDVTSDGKVTI
ncbi:hypothetical protein J7E95_37460, partial [Streptomyces sp. ISL-14]|nr:hypothetical protein [Streptomyces sp. ISL-14]